MRSPCCPSQMHEGSHARIMPIIAAEQTATGAAPPETTVAERARPGLRGRSAPLRDVREVR